MSESYIPIRRSAYNSWLPQRNIIHDKFVLDLLPRESDVSSPLRHKDAVLTFDRDVSTEQKALFASALDQVGEYYKKWASPKAIVKDWNGFLTLLDGIVESPPRFYKIDIRGVTIGEPIGVPLYLILDLVSNTSAAYTLFTDKKFNEALKKLLDSWGRYLKDEQKDSKRTLTVNEWYSPAGLAVLESGLVGGKFDETYVLDPPPNAPSFKYKTWDAFFVRKFKDGKRPVQTEQGFVFINNACESTVLRTATNIQLHDTFWLKSQNYSVSDILGGKAPGSLAGHATKFVGGSVYQAFLSPQDYHRWHSPVKGKIVASVVLPGTYYAVLPDDGAPPYDTDLVPGDPHGALIRSQPWLSVVSARSVYIIEPDPALNLAWVAFIGIGMAEVSTCEISPGKLVSPGGRPVAVNVGEEIGMFHFGGSSHTLIVKPKDGYEVIFQDFYDTPIRPGQHRWINSAIAQVRRTPVQSLID